MSPLVRKARGKPPHEFHFPINNSAPCLLFLLRSKSSMRRSQFEEAGCHALWHHILSVALHMVSFRRSTIQLRFFVHILMRSLFRISPSQIRWSICHLKVLLLAAFVSNDFIRHSESFLLPIIQRLRYMVHFLKRFPLCVSLRRYLYSMLTRFSKVSDQKYPKCS